jgi:hypothetical protein
VQSPFILSTERLLNSSSSPQRRHTSGASRVYLHDDSRREFSIWRSAVQPQPFWLAAGESATLAAADPELYLCLIRYSHLLQISGSIRLNQVHISLDGFDDRVQTQLEYAYRLPLHQPFLRQTFQHPAKYCLKRLHIDQPSRAQNLGIIRSLLQPQSQKTPQGQRVRRSPRDPALAVVGSGFVRTSLYTGYARS